MSVCATVQMYCPNVCHKLINLAESEKAQKVVKSKEISTGVAEDEKEEDSRLFVTLCCTIKYLLK